MAITLERIAEAGIVGAGGAGFPTHVKLAASADTVVINGAECEPLLHKDKELILSKSDEVVAGLAEAMRLTNATRGIIGIKQKYSRVIEIARRKLTKGMEIFPLDDTYPAGDEMILVWETLRRVVPPGGIPLAVGAVVLNVETAHNLAVCATQCVTGKYVSVAGAVSNPCTVFAPIGTPLSLCLAAAGGVTIEDPHYIIGGAMMGYLESDLSRPVTKTTGGIIVLPRSNFVVQRNLWDWKKISRVGRSACDQCLFCSELCPRNLLGHPIEPHRAMRSLGFNASARSDVPGTQFCCECNLCSYFSCPEGLDPKNVCLENKRRLLAEKKRWNNPPFQQNRANDHMKNRKIPTSRLLRRLGLSNYSNIGPLAPCSLQPKTVVIPLKQQIGAPCIASVATGEIVKCGQTIAKRLHMEKGIALGADIHASVDGTVVRIDETSIEIRV